jgi:hypothetical protein
VSRKRLRQQAAETIAIKRHSKWLKQRCHDNYDADYWNLYDGTSWRIQQGTKEEIGLMVTARLGALLLTDSKAADGKEPLCPMCGREGETSQHMILRCSGTDAERKEMMAGLRSILSRGQRKEFKRAGPHVKKMTLLGRQMEERLTKTQQKQINRIMKTFLLEVNALRQRDHGLPSMTKAALPQGIEVTMKMSQDWEEEVARDQKKTRDDQPPTRGQGS